MPGVPCLIRSEKKHALQKRPNPPQNKSGMECCACCCHLLQEPPHEPGADARLRANMLKSPTFRSIPTPTSADVGVGVNRNVGDLSGRGQRGNGWSGTWEGEPSIRVESPI
eukprot:12349777-Alexandrium_andersonii.AAC.1